MKFMFYQLNYYIFFLSTIYLSLYSLFLSMLFNKAEWLICNSLAAERMELYSFVILVSMSLIVIVWDVVNNWLALAKGDKVAPILLFFKLDKA